MDKDYDSKYEIVIKSVKDLTVQEAIKSKRDNYKYITIEAKSYPDGFWQQQPYEIDTYIAIRSKLDELVEDIDMTKGEAERFAEIYKRICANIVYDEPAAYPRNEAERQYSEENEFDCRSMKNGLLEGKCVCCGYADILRSALELVEMDACFISGPIVGERKIQKRIIAGYEKLPEQSIFRKVLKKPVEKLKNPDIDYHAWTKVKIDGEWYNADPTWDADRIRFGLIPTNALKTDKQCQADEKYDNPGPECNVEFPQKEIGKLFGNNKYIGNLKIPNSKDIIGNVKLMADTLGYLGRLIKSSLTGVKEVFGAHSFNKKKALPPAKNDENIKIDENVQTTKKEVPSWHLSRWGLTPKDIMNKGKQEEPHKDEQINDKKMEER